MNNYYDYENRMLEVKNQVEKMARKGWETVPKKAGLAIHLRAVRALRRFLAG